MRKPYAPREGSVAARAVAELRSGAMRLSALSVVLGIDRRTVYMCMTPAVRAGFVRKTPMPPDATGRVTLYEMAEEPNDEVDEVPAFQLVAAGAGVLPPLSLEALWFANPFSLRLSGGCAIDALPEPA